MSTTAPGPDAGAARTRNRRGEGARLRADILAAATELLDKAGDENAVTLRAVARRVGIAAPSIYPHFADRQSILLAVVQEALEDLRRQLASADAGAGPDPVDRLRATCTAYLDFAATHPRRYRVMFGGVWNAAEALDDGAITEAEGTDLGQGALEVFVGALQDCVAAGRSGSTDPLADAIAVWVALHGLAHQRAVSPLFPWPEGMADRLVDPLARLLPPG